MGSISAVLLLPVMAPVWGFTFVLERLRDEAEAVMSDEGRGMAELIDLSMRRSAGKISDAEFAEQEAELLRRLSSIRDYREQMMSAELDENEPGWIAAEFDENGGGEPDAEPDWYENEVLGTEPDTAEAQC